MPDFTVMVIGDDPTELLFSERKLVAYDSETTGLEFTDELIGYSLAWWADASQTQIRSCYCAVPRGQMSLEELTIVYGRMDGQFLLESVFRQHVVVHHNQSFDYRMAYRAYRLDPPKLAHDTMHLAGLSCFNSSYRLIDLYGKHVIPGTLPPWYKTAKEDRSNISGWPLGKSAMYGRLDAEMTLRLLGGLRIRFETARMQASRLTMTTYNRDREFARIVMLLIQRGLPVDHDWCEQRLRQFKERTFVIERELTGQGLRFIGSNDLVATFLYRNLKVNGDMVSSDGSFISGEELHTIPMTKTRTRSWPRGLPSVDEKTLLQFKRHPQVKLILEHRGLTKAIGTWLEPYMQQSSIDGRVHSLINPFGTVSRRISASHLNVAALPMEDRGDAFGSFKGMFKGKPGHTLMAYDLKQAEVRLAAMCARAHSLAKMFAADRDPYVEMADVTWHNPSRRQDAKRAVLSGIYEIGPSAYATKYDVEEQVAYVILDAFRRSFPEIKRASRMDADFVTSYGYIPAWDGTPRWFGEDAIDPAYKAFNQRVQMGIARLMATAMLDIEHELPGLQLMQTYDSVLLEVPNGDMQRVTARVSEIMSSAVPDNLRKMTQPHIPMLVEAKPWQIVDKAHA